MSLDGNCGKSDVVLCMPGPYHIFLPEAAIIAAGHRDILATRHCRPFYRCFCLFIQQGLVELTKILGRVVHTGDCTAQYIPNKFYRVAVWWSCRLLHLGDIALLKEIKDCPSVVRCGVIVFVAVVIPESLPGKWHQRVSQNAPLELTSDVSVGGHKRRFGTTMENSPDVSQTTTSLDLCLKRSPGKRSTGNRPSTR